MQQTLLTLIWLDVAKRDQVYIRVVQWGRAEAYEVDRDELQKYPEYLAADLKQAEGKILVRAGYFDQDSPTQLEEMRIVFPTMLCGKNPEDNGECVEKHNEEPAEHDDSATESEGN